MLPRRRRRRTQTRGRPNLLKYRKLTLLVGRPQGATLLEVILLDLLTPTIFFTLIIRDVYAKYVGPYDGFIAYSIWVPKTLVTNQRGPIAKWVPKTKQ